MGTDRAAVAQAAAAARWAGPAAEEQPWVLGGNALGFAYLGALAGCAGAIPERRDLLAPAQGGGRSGRAGRSLARAALEPGPEGLVALGRDLRRRQLCAGEKRGSEVGKTKRGKGTKWMVLVDGEGVPVGALLASASPAEVNLLEPMLETVPLPVPGRPPQRRDPERIIADKAYDSDAVDKLPMIHVPTLILVGDHDERDPSLSKEMHKKIAGSKLVILPKSGHMTFADQPDLLIGAVDSFLHPGDR